MESAPLNASVSSARDLKKQNKQNKYDGARFVFFRVRFVLSCFCSSEAMCIRPLSINFICSVVMVTGREEVTAILGQAVISMIS